jgi:hypothetical protein
MNARNRACLLTSSPSRPWRSRTLLAGMLGSMLFAVGCGPLDDLGELPQNPAGPICYQDSDCVPNGCCGRGTGAVHKDNAPQCGGQVCDGQCPTNGVNCGCGIPVCRDSSCTVATTVSDQCPGQ